MQSTTNVPNEYPQNESSGNKRALAQTQEKFNYSALLSGSLMVAGTAVGAGILGIPLATASAGFLPASLVTLGTWVFMVLTGFLFLEISFWMPDGANILSMTSRFLGSKFKFLSGSMFLFLYYCLMLAYLTAGAPLFGAFLNTLGIALPATGTLLAFSTTAALIVLLGAKWIDRTNILLSIGMIIAYILMVGVGLPAIDTTRLQVTDFSKMWLGIPVLFGAFGYHNVIPSLYTYLKRDKKVLRLSIVIGTAIACLMYMVWEYLVMGSVSQEALQKALLQGDTAAVALQQVTGHPDLFLISAIFAFFAIGTSLLGVSFSFMDFLADGFHLMNLKQHRLILCALTFLPPLTVALFNPAIFNTALGMAGGIGESFLNGILPVLIVWMGVYRFNLPSVYATPANRWLLIHLFLIGIAVMGIEAIILF